MKIVTIENTAYHASEHYRTEGPLRALELAGKIEFHRIPEQEMTPEALEGFDVFYFWNPSHSKILAFLKSAEKAGCKVWIDFDDDFENVPLYHPLWSRTDVNALAETYRFVLKRADLVTTTTAALYDMGLKYNPNTHLIPNAHYQRIAYEAPKQVGKQKILWRGSERHMEDLRAHERVFFSGDNLRWHFFGFLPYFLTDYIDFEYTTWDRSIWGYLRTLKEARPDWVIVPMIDNPFNKAISNIAWIEATYAGAAVIAPNYLPEFATLPAMTYTTTAGLTAILHQINRGELDRMRDALYYESCKRINSQYLLEYTNQKRTSCTQQLFATSKASEHVGRNTF